MSQNHAIRLLAPIVERVRTDTCCVKKPGVAPGRIKQPLTDVKLGKHLNGGPAYGVYPMLPGESTTRIALFDLDSHKGETSWPDMQERALTLLQAAERAGLAGIPFRSTGGHGIHIYFLWDEAQDSASVRAALISCAYQSGLTPGTAGIGQSQVEIFPKQDAIESDGFGSMFVMPLSGKSVPLDTFELEDMDRYAAVDWRISQPVPVLGEVEKPIARAPTAGIAADWQSALGAIPNADLDELDYDQWRSVIFAIHDATGGSDEGLSIAHEFSARSSKYDAKFLDERVWPYVRDERNGERNTARTILHMAKQYGWQEDVSDQFEVVTSPSSEHIEDEPLPNFLKRNQKTGEIPANVTNIRLGLSCRAIVPWELGYDAFRDDIMRRAAGPDGGAWQSFEETDYPRLSMALEATNFKDVPHASLVRVVAMLAHERTFDSAVEWLEGLAAWDGVPRCATFLRDCMGCEDNAYVRSVSQYLWSALAGRVLKPGVKAKAAVILTGMQNAGKSSLVEAISPSIQFFTTLDLANTTAEVSRLMRGRLVIELPELKGMRTGSLEHIKAMISRQVEDIRDLYARKHHQYARRFVFIGTTNDDEFLIDRTGNSRFLPVRAGQGDIQRIEREREQLWAEAATLFRQHGVMWEDADRLVNGEHEKFMIADTWEEDIGRWLAESALDEDGPRADRPFLLSDVLAGALGIHTSSVGHKAAQHRAADVLKSMGFEKRRKRVGGRNAHFWEKLTN